MTNPTTPLPVQEPAGALPHPGGVEISALLDSILSEYGWPSNPKNAARAGWTAAMRYRASLPPVTQPDVSIPGPGMNASGERVDSANVTQAKSEAVAWMTHHDEPMLFPTREEAASYCADDEEPIPLAAPQEAVERQPLTGWQPIKTAPKDGTNVLLVNRKGNIASGLWQGEGSSMGWWLRGGNRPNTFFNDHFGPTHWQPLPKPPGIGPATQEKQHG
jgi:hypothetical protein